MIELVRSRAYNNTFFEKSKHHSGQARLDLMVREWFPVTQVFCLSLPKYVGLISDGIFASDGKRRDALEEAALISLAIGAGEFGFGMYGLSGIHYRMFARLGETLGISLDELRAHPRGALRETGLLVDGIKETLTDLYRGAGCIQVVEGTAFNIVDAMDHLFRPVKGSNGEQLFTERQLEYINLHLKLEKAHSSMATEFVAALCDLPEHKVTVSAAAKTMCDLFGNYWDAMAQTVFV